MHRRYTIFRTRSDRRRLVTAGGDPRGVGDGFERRPRRGGASARRIRLVLLLAFASPLLTGCYGFSGGGGLPDYMNTAFVPPVENNTTRFTLTERLTQGLLEAVQGKLGLQLAAQTEADLVVRATLTRYSDVALNFDAREGEAAQVFQRRVTITASVEIYDSGRDEIFWSSGGVSGAGEYQPENEPEEVAEEIALENLVQKIVDGAQSDW